MQWQQKTEKVWFIRIDEKKEGPYSILDLRRHPFLTPDTLVWKEGFANWIKIRFVPELKDVFKDDSQSDENVEEIDTKYKLPAVDAEMTATLGYEPPVFFLWLLAIIVTFAYIFMRMYFSK